MIEARVDCSMDDDLRRHENEVRAAIRSLLEVGDERNNDKDFVYCFMLSDIVPTMMKERQIHMNRSKMKLIEELGT